MSVILPTHNGRDLICRAIQSILAQSLRDIEIILIDDGSSDGTSDLVRQSFPDEKRLVYLRNAKNLGIQKTLNAGLQAARAPYVARIDDDDEWADSEKLAKQKEFLDKNPDYVLVGTGVIVQDESGREMFRFLNPVSDQSVRRRILFKNCFTHSSVMFRREAALSFGGYDQSETARHAEDYDLWLKLGTVGKLRNLSDYAVRFTLRARNISSMNKIEQFRRGLALIDLHGRNYPHAGWARLFIRLKLAAYKSFTVLPPAWQRSIFKSYKQL